MHFKTRVFSLLATLACALGLMTTRTHAQEAIQGAGATFPALIYQQWGEAYARETGVALHYKPTGSGDGVKQAKARSVQFGATDTQLAQPELRKAELVQFPTVVGAIVPVVHLPGVAADALQLDGDTLGAIFAGHITRWDDARIARLNPDQRLPALPVTRIVRADASGSTETFTRYLELVAAPAWKGRAGKTVDWGGKTVAARGTDGVVEALLKQPGSVAYVSYDRVQKRNLASIRLSNAQGNYVGANEDTMRAAVMGANLARDLNASLLNAPGARTWPIAELTYILVPATPERAADLAPALRFFGWALQKGDTIVRQTGFVALPAMVQAAAFRTLMSVRAKDGTVVLAAQHP